MKITIELSECEKCGLSPNIVYKRLAEEYYNQVCKVHNKSFWGLQHACDTATRELYSHIVSRKMTVTNLILTYQDAERCFEIFKLFADVWVKEFNAS